MAAHDLLRRLAAQSEPLVAGGVVLKLQSVVLFVLLPPHEPDAPRLLLEDGEPRVYVVCLFLYVG